MTDDTNDILKQALEIVNHAELAFDSQFDGDLRLIVQSQSEAISELQNKIKNMSHFVLELKARLDNAQDTERVMGITLRDLLKAIFRKR